MTKYSRFIQYKEINLWVDFVYEEGDPGVHTYSNGDPGYPPTADEFYIEHIWLEKIDIFNLFSSDMLEEVEKILQEPDDDI